MKIPGRLKQGLLLGAGALVLALVFLAYLQPSFVLDLASRIVLCF